MIFIDIHTHTITRSKQLVQIVNCFPDQIAETLCQLDERTFISSGLHPWYIADDADIVMEQMNSLKEFAIHPQCLALGEAGLDKVRGAGPETQQAVFEEQVALSESVRKPLIIHCVKSYPELIQLRKRIKVTMPWIIHGFRGNSTIAAQLIRHDCYLSFGEKLRNSQKLQRLFNDISLENVLFETDEAGCQVKEIYQAAAEIKKIDLPFLQQQIEKNLLNAEIALKYPSP